MNRNDEIFKRKKNIPQYWFNKSCDLRASAGIIWHVIHDQEQSAEIIDDLKLGDGFDLRIATFDTFYLLCGLSLELIYKAICVAKKKTFPTSHNLVDFANLAEVSITPKEKGLLLILTEAVIWDSKYPVPTDKRKQDLENLSNLRTEFLYDEIQVSEELKVLRGNNAINWDSFNNLWSNAGREFLASNRYDHEYLS